MDHQGFGLLRARHGLSMTWWDSTLTLNLVDDETGLRRRLSQHHVDKARAKQDFSKALITGVDEKSYRRGITTSPLSWTLSCGASYGFFIALARELRKVSEETTTCGSPVLNSM